jgi:hypothetical protein
MLVNRIVWASLAAASAVTTTSDMNVNAAVRVRMLEGSGRSSVVIELAAPPARVERHPVSAATVSVDFGPLAGRLEPRDFLPAAGAPIAAPISLRSVPGMPAAMGRVTVAAHPGCDPAVRSAGRRIYVDIVCRQAPVRASQAAAPAAAERHRPAVEGPVRAETAPEAEPAAGPAPALSRLAGASYDRLAGEGRQMAAALASRADVTRLLALRAFVVQRDHELGGTEPAVVAALLGDIDKALSDARALRLKLDRKALSDEPSESARRK